MTEPSAKGSSGLSRIMDLHFNDGGVCGLCAVPDGTGYASLDVDWPCETYRLVAAAVNETAKAR